jgi:hypothetical protein
MKKNVQQLFSLRSYSTKFEFKIIHQSSKSKARVCEIQTPHGIIQTPNFVPVGTTGTMKAIGSIFSKINSFQRQCFH